MGHYNYKHCFLVSIEWFTVAVVIFLSIALFSIPSVIFFLYRDNNQANWRESIAQINSQLLSCDSSSYGNHSKGSQNQLASTLTNTGSNSSTSSCVPYPDKGLCYSSLQAVLAEHGVVTANVTTASNLASSGQLELKMEKILKSSFISAKCKKDGFSIYCHFLFPPCVSNGAIPFTQNKCSELKTKHCQKEIKMLSFLKSTPLYRQFSYLDPNCATLPKDRNSTKISSLPHVNSGNGSLTNSTSACSSDFVKVCSLCMPSCTKLYYSNRLGSGLVQPDDLTKIIFSSVCIVNGATFLVFSMLKWREVFTFPIILVFYENFMEMTIAIIILVPFAVGPGRLFCSFPDVVRTLHHLPTPFCSFSGFMFHFGIITPMMFWVLHLGYIQLLLSFPLFGEHKLKKWTKQIHAIAVPAVVLLGLVGPIVVINTIGYVAINFPPSVCFPSNMDAVFYAIALPACILICSGLILMVLIIREVHKSFRSTANELKMKLDVGARKFFSAPEIKLIILSVAFLLMGITVLSSLAHSIATQGEYSKNLVSYSKCQLRGSHPSCLALMIDETARIVKVALKGVSYLCLSLTPIMNIFFIMKLSDFTNAKNWLNTKRKQCYEKCCLRSYYRK